MSTISLYDPSLSAFASVSTVVATNTASSAMLLLNILIELRVHSVYLADQSVIKDDTQSLRNDVVAHGAYV